MSDDVLQDPPSRLLLGAIQVSVPVHLILKPFLIVNSLLLLRHLLFIYLRMVDKAHWAGGVLSCWSVFIIAANHLLLHELERVRRHRLRHYVRLHALYAVLELVTRHPLEHLFRVRYLGNNVMLTVYESGNGHGLSPVLVVLNHACEAIDLAFVVLLRA